MKFALILITLALASCSTRPTAPEGLNLRSEKEYQHVLNLYTDRQQRYTGLYNTMDVTASLINSAVSRAQVEQKARLLQWNRAQFDQEIEKARTSLRQETVLFVSFFTPDRKNDDLQKLTTQWRMYLEVDGRRWEPKVTRLRQPLAEIQGLYPYHNRFASAYQLSFPIATTTVEGTTSRFIVTGPLGISTIEFKPVDATLVVP